METSAAAVEPIWREAFGDDTQRPCLYKTNLPDEDGLTPLNEPQLFIQDLQGLSHSKLYALAANGQLALKLAQDEYMMIDRIIKRIKDKEAASDPQAMEERDIFEEEKEATLYGYKYIADKPALLSATLYGKALEAGAVPDQQKKDVRLPQDPFAQGNFYPTKWDRDYYRKLKAKAPNPNNLDGWELVSRKGKKLVPRLNPRKEDWLVELERKERAEKRERRATKRKAAQINGENGERRGSSSSIESQDTPSRGINKPLTRFRGRKHPPTSRDVSEAPSALSTPRGRQQNTPRGIYTPVTPMQGGSPKRRKLNPTPKSTARARPTELNGALDSNFSRKELFEKKWEAGDLVATVTLDHAWLNDDPTKALQWKAKILASKFPVRTFSMFKKWAFWKDNGQAKRPRRTKGEKKGPPLPHLRDLETEDSEDPLQKAARGTSPSDFIHSQKVTVVDMDADDDDDEEDEGEESEDERDPGVDRDYRPTTDATARTAKARTGGTNTPDTPTPNPMRRSTRSSRRASD